MSTIVPHNETIDKSFQFTTEIVEDSDDKTGHTRNLSLILLFGQGFNFGPLYQE